MKIARLLVIALQLASTPLVFSQSEQTPESVAKAFVEGAKSLDLKTMMGCFAIDDYVRNYDFAYVVNQIEWINLQSQLLPGKYQIYQDLNEYTRTLKVVDQIAAFVFYLATGGDESLKTPHKIVSPDEVGDFIAKSDPSPIRNMKLRDIRYPVSKKDNETVLKLFAYQAKMEGAQDATERVALIEMNGVTYVIPFRFLKYASNWKTC